MMPCMECSDASLTTTINALEYKTVCPLSHCISPIMRLGTDPFVLQKQVYKLNGPLFFGSVSAFREAVDACFQNETQKTVALDFSQSKLWDSSALVAVDDAASKMESSGVAVTLRYLSPDCATLLKKAGDLVEVRVGADPVYQVATDYGEIDLARARQGRKTFVKLEPWQKEALLRQTSKYKLFNSVRRGEARDE